MSATAMLAAVLGFVLAPVFAVKAISVPDGPAASVCGMIALAALLGAVALVGLIVRVAVPR